MRLQKAAKREARRNYIGGSSRRQRLITSNIMGEFGYHPRNEDFNERDELKKADAGDRSSASTTRIPQGRRITSGIDDEPPVSRDGDETHEA